MRYISIWITKSIASEESSGQWSVLKWPFTRLFIYSLYLIISIFKFMLFSLSPSFFILIPNIQLPRPLLSLSFFLNASLNDLLFLARFQNDSFTFDFKEKVKKGKKFSTLFNLCSSFSKALKMTNGLNHRWAKMN